LKALNDRETSDYISNVKLYEELNNLYGFVVPKVVEISYYSFDTIENFIENMLGKGVGIEFFRKLYIKFIKEVPDGSLDLHYDDLTVPRVNLTHVPFFVRKYNKIKQLDMGAFPELIKVMPKDIPKLVKKLNLTQCLKLESVSVESTNMELGVSDCDALNHINYKITANSEGTRRQLVAINVFNSKNIKSAKNFNIENAGKMIDINIKNANLLETFEGFKFDNVNIIFNSIYPYPNIKSFFGISNPSTDTKLNPIVALKNFKITFPNIKSADDVYESYIEIMKKYPDLLENPKLGFVYKTFNPKSLEEFEAALNKIKNYNVDFNMLGMLMELLSK
jgi:hypothetical protein